MAVWYWCSVAGSTAFDFNSSPSAQSSSLASAASPADSPELARLKTGWMPTGIHTSLPQVSVQPQHSRLPICGLLMSISVCRALHILSYRVCSKARTQRAICCLCYSKCRSSCTINKLRQEACAVVADPRYQHILDMAIYLVPHHDRVATCQQCLPLPSKPLSLRPLELKIKTSSKGWSRPGSFSGLVACLASACWQKI